MRKVLYSGIILLILGIVLNTALFALGKDALLNTEEIKKFETFKSEDISKLFINSKRNGSEIKIVSTNNDEFKVEMKAEYPVGLKDKLELDANVFNNSLIVEPKNFSENDIHFNIRSRVEITVFVPNKNLDEITVQTNVGSVDLSDINVNNLKVASATGKITLNRVNTVDSIITSNVGKIELYEVTGNITASTDTGAIDMRTDEVSSMTKLKSQVGAIDVLFSKKPSDIKIEASTNVGSVDINLPGLSNESHKKYYSGTIGNGSKQLILETETGSIKVN
jgi:lia operon protein LiaG